MPRIESGFVPLPKVEQEQPLNNGIIYLSLPEYVDQDRIGVNVSRIEDVQKLSGIGILSVLGIADAETSKEIPTIAGFNSDGSAVAGKINVVTVPKSGSVQGPMVHQDRMDLRNTALSIGINIDEISQIASNSKNGARDTQVWSKELDKEVRVNLREAGTENLVRHWDGGASFAYVLAPAWIAAIDLLIHNPQAFLLQYPSLLLMFRSIDIAMTRKDPHFRNSFFPRVQLDRAVLLQLKSRTQKFITDLHSKKK